MSTSTPLSVRPGNEVPLVGQNPDRNALAFPGIFLLPTDIRQSDRFFLHGAKPGNCRRCGQIRRHRLPFPTRQIIFTMHNNCCIPLTFAVLWLFASVPNESRAEMPLAWSVGESELLEAPIINPEVQPLPKPTEPDPIETIPVDALALPAEAIEDPPLQQEVVRWYQYPTRWMRGWDSHAEIGLDGSDGNADTFAFQTGLELKRQTDRDKWFVDIDYRRVTSRGVTTEDNGRFNLDYDRLIGDTRWSAFGKLGLEFDTFKAFDSRLNLNGGAGYHWIKSDTTSLVTRFGAGTSREFGGPNEDWVPEAVFGIEGERQLTARQKLKAKIDYFPSWEDFGNYRLVFDGSWEILLDGSENLSLKLAVTDRYDSTPEGALPNDVYYSLLLLYKF